MQHKIKIAPSMLSSDFANLRREIERCNEADVDVIHIDVMDGHFVPNITMGPLIVEAIKPFTEIPIDCHLMVQNPDMYIDYFVKAGADMISIHCEGAIHLHRTISLIKSYGIAVGVALNPVTPLEYAYEIAELTDFILLMSVNPGFGGQNFIPLFLHKCMKLRKFLDNDIRTSKVEIEVDGGIKADNLRDVINAGANIIVSGSGLFKGDFAENVRQFKGTIATAHSM